MALPGLELLQVVLQSPDVTWHMSPGSLPSGALSVPYPTLPCGHPLGLDFSFLPLLLVQ